jgi:hypothetical protein
MFTAHRWALLLQYSEQPTAGFYHYRIQKSPLPVRRVVDLLQIRNRNSAAGNRRGWRKEIGEAMGRKLAEALQFNNNNNNNTIMTTRSDTTEHPVAAPAANQTPDRGHCTHWAVPAIYRYGPLYSLQPDTWPLFRSVCVFPVATFCYQAHSYERRHSDVNHLCGC